MFGFNEYSFAITTNGLLYGWGINEEYQLTLSKPNVGGVIVRSP